MNPIHGGTTKGPYQVVLSVIFGYKQSKQITMFVFALLTCLLLPKARKTQKRIGSRGATYASCLY